MDYLKDELDKAIELAKLAAKIVQDIRRRPYNITEKPHGEGPVTEADLAVSEFLVKELSRSFPEDLIISEEVPVLYDLIQDRRTWFVDPIDGTKDFIANSEEWSIMLGLAINGRALLGVVYQPDLEKLYFAVEGQGAFLKTSKELKPLKVRTIINIREAVLTQSHTHYSKKVDRIAQELGITKVLLQSSIGLKLCQIAEGHADLYFNFSKRCHLWDLCAPEIILREAGGIIAHDMGEPLSYASIDARIDGPFVAAAAGIFEKVQVLLKRG